MKGPLILVIAVVVVAALGLGLWTRSAVSVPKVVTTNALPAVPEPAPPSTQAEVILPEAAAPNLRPTPREIVGIGAVITRNAETGEHMINSVLPDSPAAAAGLAGKFIIRKIDDTIAEGMSLEECVNLVRGAVDTKVRLELFDVEANEVRTVELTRQKIQVQRKMPSTPLNPSPDFNPRP